MAPRRRSASNKSDEVDDNIVEGTRRGRRSSRSASPQVKRSILKSSSRSPTPKSSSSSAKKGIRFTAEVIQKHQAENGVDDDFEYEFGGTPGALGIIFGLPLVIYLLYFLSSKDYECLMTSNLINLDFDWKNFVENIVPHNFNEYYTYKSLQIYLAWMLFQVILERILPGERVVGVKPYELIYYMSGHLQFWLSIMLLVFGNFSITELSKGTDAFKGWDAVYVVNSISSFDLSILYDEYLGLITASCIFSFVLSIYLYISSFMKDGNGEEKVLAHGGNTGKCIYDFFIGRELNPRLFNNSLDLKEFCELRPGLIGWCILNIGMAYKQCQLKGYVSFSMVLVVLYQGGYVWDALYNERAILTTMDITTDGFGYMLAFGDLAWVPFIYSLQARYLVEYDPNLSYMELIIISLLHFLGLYIFRKSNSEKDAFRRDPDSSANAHLKYMPTKRGTKLLVSGWWGMARKINYTGDWIITFAWCLLCGYDSPIPYFQALYFLILLIHRADRDDKMCAEKYGDDWEEYKRKVPYMFIPYVI